MPNSERVAVVTGANRGIGFEICRQLATKKIRVIMTSRDPKKGMAARDLLLKENLPIDFHVLDVSSPASIEEFFHILEEHHHRLDILVNNAAIHYDSNQQAINAKMKIVLEAFDTNVIGPWHLSQLAIPMMKKNGYGRIVNVSSGAGSLEEMKGGTPAYSVSKAALNALTIKFSHELAHTNIKINAVCPGWVRTDMGGEHAPRSVKEGAKGIIWAATLPDNGPTGGFFRDGKPISW